MGWLVQLCANVPELGSTFATAPSRSAVTLAWIHRVVGRIGLLGRGRGLSSFVVGHGYAFEAIKYMQYETKRLVLPDVSSRLSLFLESTSVGLRLELMLLLRDPNLDLSWSLLTFVAIHSGQCQPTQWRSVLHSWS